MTREQFKKGLMLFAFFVKIGCFTFGGGWGILAQMEQEFINRRQLITKSDLLDLTAVGKSVPGIMITNISMLFGYQVAGLFGGICCVAGIALPAVVILSLVTVFYDVLKDNFWCFCALKGISCAVVPIIGSAALSLGKEAFKARGGIAICAAAFLFCYFTNVSNIVLIGLGILASLLWMNLRSHAPAGRRREAA